MKGVVLDYDARSDKGLVRAENGMRYPFCAADCRNGVPLAGCSVDFEENENAAAGLFITHTPVSVRLDRLFWFLFSFKGRVSRDAFLVFLPFWFCALSVTEKMAETDFPVCVSGVALLFICFFSGLCVTVKRFHDTGKSGRLIGALIVAGGYFLAVYFGILPEPFRRPAAVYAVLTLYGAGAAFCLYACFAKGDGNKNAYGEEPAGCRTVLLK